MLVRLILIALLAVGGYLAVRRMLPKNRSGRDMLRRLKVYSGTDHPHVAQSPEPLQF